MASIEQLGDRRWKARYRTPDGRSRSRTFRRKVDARRFLDAVEAGKHRGEFVDPMLGRRPFGDWWRAWRATRVDLRPSTSARDDTYYRNHIEPAFAAVPLAAIDRTMLRQWVAELSAKGLAPGTVQKAAQLVRKCLAAAVDERLIPSNPADRLELPLIEAQEMRFLTPAEIAALADAIDRRYRAFVLTAAYCGLRLGELAGLRRSRVDLMRRRIDVAEIAVEVRGVHHFGPPKTRAGRRSVPIPAGVADEIGAHVAGLEPDDLVFPAPSGDSPIRASLFRRRIWQPAVAAAGVDPLRIHDLRHTAVALWIAAGASPKEIAVRAGHSSVAVVLDRYGHLLPGSEDRVDAALDAMFTAGSRTADVVELRR